jgi:hypothetical protein
LTVERLPARRWPADNARHVTDDIRNNNGIVPEQTGSCGR